ncbi:MAG: hypothetical protein HOO91_11685 [Bacteroidales bacterium]|nr:hypothetical protein [Bacteroidales bacterium]
MGIFNFSQKKKATPNIKDMIWMSQSAKLTGCFKLLQEQKEFVVVAWFSKTQEEFHQFLNEQHGLGVEIQLAQTAISTQISDKKLILLEHFPLRGKEETFIINLNPSQVIVLSSLDEPLFEIFGSDEIIRMMKSLGMKEDEMIEHPMISKSIVRAQQKLEQKVICENFADSSKEWFQRNGSI